MLCKLFAAQLLLPLNNQFDNLKFQICVIPMPTDFVRPFPHVSHLASLTLIL